MKTISYILLGLVALVAQEIVSVSAITAGLGITDVDLPPDDVGVAVVESVGTQYSLNGGTSWLPASDGLLLGPTASVRVEPDGWLRVRGWDGTVGTSGTVYEITETGGETAFSEGVGTVSFVDAPVEEDGRLALKWNALSAFQNPATLTNVQYAIAPVAMATVETPGLGDPQGANMILVPSGTLGTFTLTVSGTNKKGVVITSDPFSVDVVAGAAVEIQIEVVQ